MLHRNQKDGGREELYVCGTCRDNADGKTPATKNTTEAGTLFLKITKPLEGSPGEEANLVFDALRKVLEKRFGLKKEGGGEAERTAPAKDAGEEEARDGGKDENADGAPADEMDGTDAEFSFDAADPREPSCEACGMPRAELRRGQRLGCPACYEAFAHEVSLMIRDMHKGTRHVEDEA